MTQDFSALGLPVTIGHGRSSRTPGAGVDFRGVPSPTALRPITWLWTSSPRSAVDMTDRLAVGAVLFVGNSFLDGPFIDTGGHGAGLCACAARWARITCPRRHVAGRLLANQKDFTFEDAVLFPGGTVERT